jgi:hypothetical protein
MPGRRAIEVRLQPGDASAPPKWRMSLLENTFAGFLQGADADAAARAVFAEGSLFSPYLLGNFFDPADAFPLWEFEPEVLLAALRRGAARTTVDWGETDTEYYLRADIPGTRSSIEIARCSLSNIQRPCPSFELISEVRTFVQTLSNRHTTSPCKTADCNLTLE